MASTQSTIVSLTVMVKGRPTTVGSRVSARVIEKGTVGFLGDKVETAPWEYSPDIYEFFPNRYTETPGAGGYPRKIVVVAETVVLPDLYDEPTVAIPIYEAGFTYLSDVAVDPGILTTGRRCMLHFENGGFTLKPLRNPTYGPFVGRILSCLPSTPLFSGGTARTSNVEFFRQRELQL